MDINATIKTETPEEHDLDVTTTLSRKRSRDNEGKLKLHRRTKIRRLADDTPQTNKHVSKCKRILVFSALFTFTIAVLMGHYYTKNNSNTKQILKEFLKNYRNQYTQIIHGKQNYCDQKQQLATPVLFERIKEYRILNQEKSLQQIEVALRNESDLNAIGLVGDVGVGKSLFMRAMMENFPWQENVHKYNWNTFVKDDAEKVNSMRLLIEKLSDCGQNLLVIEDLRPTDHGFVSIINGLIKESIDTQAKRIVVFYVFSLNTMLPRPKYEEERQLLHMLPHTNIIQFKSFGKEELKDCIERESQVNNIQLGAADFDEIVATIEPSKSGCKNVLAKVLMFGSVQTKSKDNL